MNSVPTDTRKPRRKWGWLFVILFVVQAFVFIVVIDHTNKDAGRSRSLEMSFLKSGNTTAAVTDGNRAQVLENQVRRLTIAFGVVSVICIGGTILGFRRRS